MELADYMKAKRVATKWYGGCKINCEECPLGANNNSLSVCCEILEMNFPHIAETIFENSVRKQTNLTKGDALLAEYPSTYQLANGVPFICPQVAYGKNVVQCSTSCEACCCDFWQQRKDDCV